MDQDKSSGTGDRATDIIVEGQQVEGVDHLCYLGSVPHSSGRSFPDLLRRIGIGSASKEQHVTRMVMRQAVTCHKLRVYQTGVEPVHLYGFETWTLLKTEMQRLQDVHMQFQRSILNVKWYDHVMNTEVASLTGLEPISTIVSTRKSSVFGHFVRLAADARSRRNIGNDPEVVPGEAG